MGDFYDGTKLLSMQDINGEKPEILISTSNRSAGKSTYFNRYATRRFINNGEKFALLYRFNYELDDVCDKFFKDIHTLFFPDYHMTSKRKANGIFHELFLNDKPCGYALSINSADQIKKFSHLLSDTERIIFDEFQSETNHYCSDEVKKVISIHTSIARGQGKQVRFVPMFLIGNFVSILNPYYTALGISARLKKDTKYLRGDGFVLEQGFNKAASEQQSTSAFNRAFAGNAYVLYSSQNVYLNDNESFIERMGGKSKYLCTLKCDGELFAVREFTEEGIIYCDDKADATFYNRIAVTTDDHAINYVMLKNNDFFLSNLRYLFERGCFRFKNLRCKEIILKTLSY